MDNILYVLIRKGFLFEAFVAARYCYRVGFPTLTDNEYDQLEAQLREEQYSRCREYLERSYDDDPVPSALLKVLGIREITPQVPEELYRYLEEEKSNSIRSVRAYADAYAFVIANKGKQIMFSLKIDGVNAKTLYTNGNYRITLSRGRGRNCIDYTQGAKHTMPATIPCGGIMKVTGEFFTDKSKLTELREKYRSDQYKTSKSAAISMLRVEHREPDYEHLRLFAFGIEGKTFNTVSESYQFLESLGFQTPPHFCATPQCDSLEEFSEWLKDSVFTPMSELADGLPSDGVVMEVDDLTEVFKEEHQYSDRQIALKFEQWGFERLKGRITDIIISQKRVYKSVRIKIEPLYSSDGCKAQYINSFNPGILIENELFVGKDVWFERNSGAVNILIHGEKLKGLIGGDDDDV